MRITLRTEECGGFVRYLPVRQLDSETRLRALRTFAAFQTSGVICQGNYPDNVWKLTNELQEYTLDFHIDAETFRQKAERWIGCTGECYQECMKAYAAFSMGAFSLSYLCSILRNMKALAGMTDAEAVAFSGGCQSQLVDFLSLIPESNDLRDAVIEAFEDRKWDARKSGPRKLADFPRYLKFNKDLDNYWATAPEKEKQFYFPVFFWWKLTAILPLRVTEFLVTPRNCVQRTGEKFTVLIRRTKLKKAGRKLSYKIESDYRIQQYEIPEWLYREIRRYQDTTANDPFLPKLDTLLVPECFVPLGYFTYVKLEQRLKRFFLEILGDKDYPVRAGDTRHLAMINLILSGGSPVICRELAGHESIGVSSHYYANLSTVVESMVYERCHGWAKESPLKGFLRFPAALPDVKIRVNQGWCDVPAIGKGDITECLKCYDGSGKIGDCVNCAHFYPDSPGLRLEMERRGKAAVDEDGEYLMRMIELVRKGLGCQEDIATALLRLQSDSHRYGALLSQRYCGGDGNGQA